MNENAIKRRHTSGAGADGARLVAAFPTRRQWFGEAAGAAIGGAAVIAESAIRPTAAFAQSSGQFVDLTSNQTIGGVKTFTSPPVVPVGTFALPQVPGTAMVAANVTGPFAPLLSGAMAPTRYVGGTTSGAPTTGVFAVGDFVIDQTGKLWICTLAGSPGTWVQQVGSGVDLTTDQTVAGVKTFTSPPVVPLASLPEAAVAGLVADLAAKQEVIPPGTYVEVSQTQGGTLSAPDALQVFTIQPFDPAKAAFVSLIHGVPFTTAGTTKWDYVWSQGYNYGPGGSFPVPTEPSLVWQIETSYFDNIGRDVVESFWQYGPPNNAFGGNLIRPIFVSYDQGAVRRSAAQISFIITSPLLTFAYPADDGTGPTMATLQQNNFVIEAPDSTSSSGIQINAAVGRNSAVRLGANGLAARAFMSTNGIDAGYIQVGANIPIQFGQKPGGGPSGGWAAINSGSSRAALTVAMGANPPNILGLVVTGKSGGTADIFNAQSSGGDPLLRVGALGSVVVGNAALANDATDGFLYLPTMVGTPSGVPTTQAGAKAAVYDTTADKLWIYNGAWKSVALV